MFKKPKRHFRQRKLTDGDGTDEDERENDSESPLSAFKAQSAGTLSKKGTISGGAPKPSNGTGKKKKQESKAKPTAISFEVEGEDEETFQVKKSSKSRMLVKKMKKEKKKEKSERDSSDDEQTTNTTGVTRKADVSVVLNGDRAADMELDSDCEPDTQDDENKQPKHSFRSVFERGEIPDANLIHLARKKRAQAREQGDYIPLDDTENKVEQPPKSTQRLVRDDDNDMSDDEDRVDFSVNSTLRDRQRMKDDFLAAEHGSDSGEDEHERDWEQQQIRKVVGDQVTLEHPTENADQNYYNLSSANADYSSMNSGYNAIPDNINLQPLPETVSLDQIRRSLTERLTNLQQVNRVHTQERENVRVGLEQSRKSADELENRREDSVISKLNNKYQFMQEMRSYVRDLLDCFNDKYEKVGELDSKLMALYQARADKLCKRRQEDIKDEANDCSSAPHNKGANEAPSEKRQQAIKQRRVADRESRRTRRRQARQQRQQQTQHNDGMSSDDEESKSDQIKFQTDTAAIISEANSLLDDVVDEFALTRHILSRFTDWKRTYSSDYNDAYVGLCLPKLLSPLIKLSLIEWNPLEDDPVVLTECSWYRPVILYGHHTSQQFDTADPDNELLPLIVEKVLIPKLTGYVDMVWDPLSRSQTLRLSTLIHTLVDQYPSLNSSSKNTANLLRSLSQRISVSLDEDTFMPLYAKDLLMRSSDARTFLHRQIWSCIKLFQNILKFSAILSDGKLKVLALDSLLNRYIMLGLQCAGTDNCLKRIKAIVDSLPSCWLKSAKDDVAIPQLENLCRYIKICVSSYHDSSVSSSESIQRSNRENMKALLKVLVSIHALDHAKRISDEFSLRMPK